jgi:GNAT superfamily N-acetyltransferase
VTLGERLAAYGLVLPDAHTLEAVHDRPELRGPLGDLNVSVWPEFMLQDPVADEHWGRLFSDFAAFQVGLFAPDGVLVAGCNSAPLAWDGTDDGLPEGWDDQFLRSVRGVDAGVDPDTLGALQIVVRPDRQGAGYSGLMVQAMRAMAAERGFRGLIACVRPTDKERYPLTPIERYAWWTREDGLPLDPWIRLHVRLGGRIVRASPASMRMEGTLAEWIEWTGLAFPESGQYLPQGAAAPVRVDVERDRGVYLDPNVWVVHAPG